MRLKDIKIKDTASYKEVLDLVYPVGALYWSFNSISPATLFGGTWVQITNTFIRAENTSGLTGGSNNITLTTNQMPKHSHTGPSHSHGVGTLVTESSGGHAHFLCSFNNNGEKTYLATYKVTATPNSTSNWYGVYDTFDTTNVRPSGAVHSTETSSTGWHSHTISGNTAAAGTGSTGFAGNGQSFNNMPYYTTAYCWRRTA